MTTIYVHDSEQTQAVRCSDGSQGVMQVNQKDSAPYYGFRFYSHEHPSFWVNRNQFHDGEGIVVKDIQSEDDFRLKFV